ncbi:MAG: hypothetical protein A2Y62_07370 [Candidatus Fischerbacteria bacterium RBG_13_37_8]|uniref:Uncharacterized protein n=1 Tax=Candidatus Fischerbacteria bacterium RBG_13_37_8 TaxID=1817863 RepID=A0A1F5VVR5_9BACT|nr:MAG: hypothetical protein A2Y62_07370 [Candidatus Fischerbacteria bacterium RBG_13_37_8]
MKKIGKILFKILFWTYPRGSWQYDVFCVLLILGTIFIKPDFLLPKKSNLPIKKFIITSTSDKSNIPQFPVPSP